MPETVVAVYGNAARERLERVKVVFPHDEALALLVVFLYGKDAEGEDLAVSRACQLRDVAILAFRGRALESVGRRVLANAIDSGDPQSPLGIACNVLNVVVGQARGIVGAEILIILVAVILVEAPERGYPHLPIAVFGKSLDVLVGNVVGYHHRVVLVDERGLLATLAATIKRQAYCGEHQEEGWQEYWFSHGLSVWCLHCKNRHFSSEKR